MGIPAVRLSKSGMHLNSRRRGDVKGGRNGRTHPSPLFSTSPLTSRAAFSVFLPAFLPSLHPRRLIRGIYHILLSDLFPHAEGLRHDGWMSTMWGILGCNTSNPRGVIEPRSSQQHSFGREKGGGEGGEGGRYFSTSPAAPRRLSSTSPAAFLTLSPTSSRASLPADKILSKTQYLILT